MFCKYVDYLTKTPFNTLRILQIHFYKDLIDTWDFNKPQSYTLTLDHFTHLLNQTHFRYFWKLNKLSKLVDTSLCHYKNLINPRYNGIIDMKTLLRFICIHAHILYNLWGNMLFRLLVWFYQHSRRLVALPRYMYLVTLLARLLSSLHKWVFTNPFF